LRALVPERLDDLQGDEVFSVTIADQQQGTRTLADTIR
jgi:hypothetical protein